uniref:Bestrophin homolog n=1 Tax=Heligmosomoides polygyrus TaxID=6339 RepID=A0A183GJG1_HELPZ
LTVSTIVIGSISYMGYLVTPDWREIVDSKHYYSNWKIRTYLSLPFNAASRLVGGIANREIPLWLREPLLGSFARMYDCRMDEAVQSDFRTRLCHSHNGVESPLARPLWLPRLLIRLPFLSDRDSSCSFATQTVANSLVDGESSAKKRRRVRRTGDDVMAIRCSPDQRLDPNDSVSSRRRV